MAYKKSLLFLPLLMLPLQALAQTNPDAMLMDKIDRLEREMLTLQRDVYKGHMPPPADTPAATPADSNNYMSLEEEIRNLTGRIEEAEHQNQQLSEKLNAFIAQQYDAATLAPQSGQPSPVQNVQNTPVQNPPSNTTTPAPNQTQASPFTDPTPPELKAGNTEQALAATQQANNTTTPVNIPPDTDPAENLYNEAFSLLRQANYPGAESNFQKFIDTYQEHTLASNAYYWLGETYFVQKNYEQAAVQFLRGYKKFPQGTKAPDSLLKLAVSLASLGKEKEACTSLNKLFKEFPKAPNAITQRAKEEAGSHHCL